MINNLDLILPLLEFNSADDFYIASVVKRKKENPELGSNSYVAKTYVIKSVESLMFYFGEMQALSNYHNARTYINVNKRSFKKCAKEMLLKVTNVVFSEDTSNLKNAYASVCAKTPSEKNKKWLIDVDDKDGANLISICLTVDIMKPFGNKVLKILPTKNGHHIITKPFHLAEFNKLRPDIDVKKDSITLLYTP